MGDIKSITPDYLLGIVPNNPVELSEGDYKGEDGLIYCGKCHTRKQIIRDLPEELYGSEGKGKILTCRCDCQRKADAEREKQEKYEQEMLKIRRKRDASMMDSKYKNARFDSYKVTKDNGKALDIARKYTEKFSDMLAENQGLIFYGPVGTGKSFTAACIANELLDKNITVIMTSFVKILQNIQSIQSHDQDESDYISMLNNANLLILDDFGTERNTDYALEKVYNIVDSRCGASKPMIITTNLEFNAMMEETDIRYRRIYDRIFEACYPVKIAGKSFRMAVAEQRFDRMTKLMEE